jgi:hypothetical protein
VARKPLTSENISSAPLHEWPSFCFARSMSFAPLRTLVKADRLPQGIIVSGRAGLGKKAYALALASLSFCESTSACGECPPCRQIIAGQHPHVYVDHLHDDAKSVAGVARLQEHLALKVYRGEQAPYGRRIVVIADAEQLSLAASNRLLKTIEEPPPHSCVLLTSSRPQTLLATIRSRCITWQLQAPTGAELRRYLQRQHAALLTSLALSPNELELLCQRYGNSPGGVLAALSGRAAGQEDALAAFQELLISGQYTAMLKAIDAIKLKKSPGAAEIAAAGEYALNRMYRRIFLSPQEVSSGESRRLASPATVMRRRALLRGIKDLAARQNIALNAPLAAEALFYQGFFCDERSG